MKKMKNINMRLETRNTRKKIKEKNGYGYTPLHCTAKYNRYQLLGKIIKMSSGETERNISKYIDSFCIFSYSKVHSYLYIHLCLQESPSILLDLESFDESICQTTTY